MSPFELGFLESALKEWNALDNSIRIELENKLLERLNNPRIPSAALSGNLKNCFKIKSRRFGYRLTYLVDEESNMLIVLAIGRRERSAVYNTTLLRLIEHFAAERKKKTPPPK
ncbi:MAG: hypothetical protein RLZZ12_446 [Actinomycetota bacterium]